MSTNSEIDCEIEEYKLLSDEYKNTLSDKKELAEQISGRCKDLANEPDHAVKELILADIRADKSHLNDINELIKVTKYFRDTKLQKIKSLLHRIKH